MNTLNLIFLLSLTFAANEYTKEQFIKDVGPLEGHYQAVTDDKNCEDGHLEVKSVDGALMLLLNDKVLVPYLGPKGVDQEQDCKSETTTALATGKIVMKQVVTCKGAPKVTLEKTFSFSKDIFKYEPDVKEKDGKKSTTSTVCELKKISEILSDTK